VFLTVSTLQQIGSGVKPSDDIDFDDIEDSAKELASNVLDAASTRFDSTLRGIFARDAKYAQSVTDLVHGYQPNAPGSNDIMKL
jgi:hypothetical protein